MSTDLPGGAARATAPDQLAPAAAAAVAVVIPCYRSSLLVEDLVDRLCSALDVCARRCEIILVDDASPDADTWVSLKRTEAGHVDAVKCIRLASNVGQHDATRCGFAHLSPGIEIVVTMDDDLQHRPEDVAALVRAVEEGADLAVGAYDVKQHAIWRNLGGQLVDRTLRRVFALPRDFHLTSFRAMRRSVVDDVLEHRNRYSYLSAALLAVTRVRVNVPVSHQARREGRSGYSLRVAMELAAKLFLGYARWPLFLVVGLFLLCVLAITSAAAWMLCCWVAPRYMPEGWTPGMLMSVIGTGLNAGVLAVVVLLFMHWQRKLASTHKPWRIAEHN